MDVSRYPLDTNDDESVCIALNGCRVAFLNAVEGLLSLRDGSLYLISLDAPAGVVDSLSVSSLRVTSAVSSCLVVDDDRRFLFQGSRLEDSVLLRLKASLKVRSPRVACVVCTTRCGHRHTGLQIAERRVALWPHLKP